MLHFYTATRCISRPPSTYRLDSVEWYADIQPFSRSSLKPCFVIEGGKHIICPKPQGVAFVAISSNDVEAYPLDSPERMKEVAAQHGYSFPYLYDEDQSVARVYQAACTPDFYVFDGQMRLAYRGQLDGSRPRNDVPLTGKDVRAALDAIIAGEPVAEEQRPSIGCNIKWKES